MHNYSSGTFNIRIQETRSDYCNTCLAALNALSLPQGWQLKVNVADDWELCHAPKAKCAEDIDIFIADGLWLLDEEILKRIVAVFSNNKRISMIGITGTQEIPTSGIAADSWEIIGETSDEEGYRTGTKVTEATNCLAINGCFLAIRDDYDWHTDIYSDNTFAATALSLDMRRKGKLAVIVPQSVPAVWHHNSATLKKNEQSIFLDEYSRDIFPLVSILIPTYCRPQYFEQALQSALGQTYRNIEVFITDNSSDRRTADLMATKYACDNRIKYEYHPEIHTALDNWLIARKYNNENAEYVQWLMDDDVLLPEKLSVMVDYYRKNPSVTLVTSYRKLIDADGNELPDAVVNNPIVNENTLFTGKQIGKAILTSMFNFIGEPTTVLIRKKNLLNNDLGWTGKEGKYIISDFPTWLNLCEQGDVIYLREPYSLFRAHGNNQQNSMDIIHIGCICWAMMIMYAWKKKVFLETANDLDAAVVRWFTTATQYLSNARQKNIISENDYMFRRYFSHMSRLLMEAHNYTLEDETL